MFSCILFRACYFGAIPPHRFVRTIKYQQCICHFCKEKACDFVICLQLVTAKYNRRGKRTINESRTEFKELLGRIQINHGIRSAKIGSIVMA